MSFCFLISSERSGSNLITRLLDGHSKVCGPSPTHLFRILVERRSHYGELRDPERWRFLLEDATDLFETKLGSWNCSLSAGELAEEVEPGSLAHLLRYVYEKEAIAEGKEVVFVKENHIHRHAAFLERHFPDSRFVFLVRDPRDMALSWKRAKNLRGCVIRAAETWKSDQCSSLSLYHTLLEEGRVVGVRYEDLVAKTETTLKRVCSLLELEFEAPMVELDKRESNWSNASATSEWANLSKPVIQNNFRKFEGALSADEPEFIERTCHNEMKAVGYEPESKPTKPLSELRAAIEPLELYVKPQYDEQPEADKRRHARREQVLNKMREREAAALW